MYEKCAIDFFYATVLTNWFSFSSLYSNFYFSCIAYIFITYKFGKNYSLKDCDSINHTELSECVVALNNLLPLIFAGDVDGFAAVD